MLSLAQRIQAFDRLGRFLAQYKEERADEDLQKLNQYFLKEYRICIKDAELFNHWFSEDNLHFALQSWSEALQKEQLEAWTIDYEMDFFEHDRGPKTVAIIMAGNIPLVGFHDLLSVLIAGHKALVKPSSDDAKLIPFICQMLIAIDKEFASLIELADGQVKNFDAVIATGSNNSSRYFESYFGKYPHIIRKNRSSVAVLSGEESKAELERFGEDIFRYFGLGCRNVSKVYLPQDFEIQNLFEAFYKYSYVGDNNKYGNNYDYNRAIYLMEQHEFLENGFFIIKESEKLHAPVSVLHYERYDKLEEVQKELESQASEIQCLVSEIDAFESSVAFGESQKPKLWDYADNVDTLAFLRSL
jgi:hypothetical protein